MKTILIVCTIASISFYAASPSLIYAATQTKSLSCNPECHWIVNGASPPSTSRAQNQSKTVDRTNFSMKAIERSIQQAISHYPSIVEARAALAQQAEGIAVAKAGYYPAIKTGLNTGHQGYAGNGTSLSVSASQTLLDFGKVASSVSVAEGKVFKQRLLLLDELDNVALKSGTATIEVARYRLLQKSAQKQMTELRKLLLLAEQRMLAGAASQADLDQARSRLDAAQATLDSLSTQLIQWENNLRTLTGREDITLTELTIDALEAQVAQLPANVEKRNDVQLAKANVLIAHAELAQAKAHTQPTISANAGVERNLDSSMRKTPNKNEVTLTLNVSYNLFEGGAPSAQLRSAQQGLYSTQEKLRTLQLEGKNNFLTLQSEIQGLKTRMNVLKSRQKNILETRKMYQDQYLALGTRTLLDLLNAEQEIFLAETDRLNAEHDLLKNQLSYIQATGSMRDVFHHAFSSNKEVKS